MIQKLKIPSDPINHKNNDFDQKTTTKCENFHATECACFFARKPQHLVGDVRPRKMAAKQGCAVPSVKVTKNVDL